MNNTFAGTSNKTAIKIQNSSPTIINNIIADWGNGILEATATSDPDTVAYNLFFNNNCMYVDENNRCFTSLTVLEAFQPEVAHNLVGDPLFVNAAQNDYHLLRGSPAIDAGDPNSPLDPDSTGADIGVFYFPKDTTLLPPALLSPADGATNQSLTPTLSWNASRGATFYHLQVSVSNTFFSPTVDDSTLTVTSKQVGPLASNTTYFWRVKAKAGSAQSAWSSAFRFTTMNKPPAAPQNLHATAGDGQVTLAWNANTESDFLRYRIYGGTAPNPTTKIDSVDGINNTTKTITGLTNGTTYYFRITAVNTAMVESGFSNEVSGVPMTPALFTRIMAVPFVEDRANSWGSGWGDYDTDGDLDLFVANGGGQDNNLYINNGDGTFKSNFFDIVSDDGGFSQSGSWGDYDDDGDLDLFVANNGNNFLYQNNGSGAFIKITNGDIVNDGGKSSGCSWGDYDNDGDLDLFVANQDNENNFLYSNNGDGTFTKITSDIVVNDGGHSFGCSWGDYDNDGDLDLFVANGAFNNERSNFLYANNGDGTFTKVTSGPVVEDGGQSTGGSWGDLDNDGDLDLFVTNVNGPHFLYINNGNGTFAKVNEGDIVNERAGASSGWGDFDNDGDLDLFAEQANGQLFLFANNGNGTFSKIMASAIETTEGGSTSCSWGDYNGDGFLDIFITRTNGQPNALYKNAGNANHWISIKCIGTKSNRSAIGAKVRIKAQIEGRPVWQLNEISGQTGSGGQNSLNAEFGLGQASAVDSVIVQWPSKIVQILTNVSINQFLTIIEDTTAFLPEIALDSDSLDFGSVIVGRDSTLNLGVLNMGKARLVVDSLIIRGEAKQAFQVVSEANFSVNANESRTVSIKFVPDSAGKRNADLFIYHNGVPSPTRALLTGVGIAPQISVTPESIDFGEVTIGDTAIKTLEVKNIGNTSLHVRGMFIVGPGSTVFDLDDESGFDLNPDESRFVKVAFAPRTEGQILASLVIQNTPYIFYAIVGLKGTGVSRSVPVFQLSTTSLDFGNVQIGNFLNDTLTVINPGSAALNVESITISGTNAVEFSLLSATSFNVDPNASAMVLIRFRPTSTGSKSALLVITHNAAGSPSSVNLRGNGVSGALAINPDPLAFGGVNIGDSVITQITITNIGSANLAVTNIIILGKDSLEFSLQSASSFIINIGQEEKVAVRFRPRSLGNKNALLKILHDAPGGSSTVNLTGTGIDLVPPVIMNVDAVAIVEFGKPILVTALVSDNFRVAQVNLQYREGGQSTFTSTRMDSTEAGYQATIAGVVAGVRGVEFNVEAIDPSNNLKAAGWRAVQVRLPDKHLSKNHLGGSIQNAYRLISLPLASDDVSVNATLLDDLGAADTTKWRLWDIDPQRRESQFPYREYPNVGDLAPGKAVFLITQEIKMLTSGAGVTVATLTPFQTSLQPGWYMIASPFNFEIPLQNVQPESLRKDLYTYNGVWQSSLGKLQPWEGYMIKVKEAVTLTILPSETTVNPPSAITKNVMSPEWFIGVEATCERARDRDNVAGVIQDAALEWDRYERFEPPPIGEFIMVSFPHRDWQRYPDVYTTDFRPPADDGYAWDFTVDTNIPGKPVTLRFDNLELLAPALEARLIDVSLKIAQDLRRESQYVYRSNHDGGRKIFRLLIGKSDFVDEQSAGLTAMPRTYELTQNFPNPFNPSTSIKFGLPQESRVTLKIYNLLGKEIATLLNGVEKAAGYHVAIWEGRDQDGNTVPSGIYLYRLQAGQVILTKKMTLIK